ncbi:MAG: Gfo/Idh/MocA family oxidoreductase [Boseongicola sp.]|nr:Gfo/Idh/MocA family oxidoreductase [Boseongicola sp.]
MADGDALKVAMVGAGYFSQFHVEAWGRMPRVNLGGVCDRNIETARATGAPAFDDLEAMLAAVSPDILDVVVPPVAHAETLRVAFAHGVETVICQKPFCRTFGEAEIIVAEAEEAGVTLVVHENFRFQPWFRFIKSVLETGDLGELQQISFRLRPGDGQGPRAYLDRQPYFQKMERLLIHETAVHFIDTYRYLLGDPVAVYADLRRLNPIIAGEDAGFFIMDHPDGVRSLFDGNRHIDHIAVNTRWTMGEALVEGTKGVLELRGDGTVWKREFGSLERSLAFTPTTEGFAGDCVYALQEHVVAGVLDGAPFENLAEDYLTVVAIEEAVYRSDAEGCKLTL